MKRVLCLALVLTIVCALITFMPATAATIIDSDDCGAQGDNVKWTLDSDGTLTISGEGDTMDIRDGHGFPLWSAEKIKKVIIQEGVTSIADGMFSRFSDKMSYNSPIYDYPNITEIKIPGSVRSIGGSAFSGCVNLTEIKIPDGVTYIDNGAFKNCKMLANITLPDTISKISRVAFENTAYYNNQSNWTNGVLYVGKYLIEAKPDLVKGKYEVNPGTIGIADYAFENCNNLKELVIPNGLKYINDDVVFGCTNLSKINMPDSVLKCDSGFYGTAYYNNKQNWENGVLYIDNHLIRANPDELASSYQIRQGTKTIGGFAGCYNLESISIPNSVVRIDDGAFKYCDKLTNINIPNSVKSIGEEAFYGCAFTSIAFPNSITEIEFGTLSYCHNLKSMYIPRSVKKIGRLPGCENLTDVYYKGSKSEWDLINIVYHEYPYSEDSSLLNATIHYNSPMPSEATPTPKPTPTPTVKPTPTPIPTSKPKPVPTVKPTADPSAPSVEITEVSDYFVTAKVNNCDDPFAQVILAVYNKNGALIDMQQSYNFGEVYLFSDYLQNADIKVMLWSDTDSMKPLAETTEMSL